MHTEATSTPATNLTSFIGEKLHSTLQSTKQIQQKVTTVQNRHLNTLPVSMVTKNVQKHQLLLLAAREDCALLLKHSAEDGTKNSNLKTHLTVGDLNISYSAATIQSLFELICVVKDASQLPELRSFDLNGSALMPFINALKPSISMSV